MTSFERIQPLITYARYGKELTSAMRIELHDVRANLATLNLPTTAHEAILQNDTNRFLLSTAVEVLVNLSNTKLQEALDAACAVLPLPLTHDPFEGEVYHLAEQLAGALGEAELQQTFSARFDSYKKHVSYLQELVMLSDLLSDSYVMGVLDEAFEDLRENTGAMEIEHKLVPLTSPFTLKEGYAPFTSGRHQVPARAYHVEIHKLTDPRVARFATFASTLVDITDGGDLGRKDERGRLYADLVLDLGDEPGLFETLKSDDLALRFVFRSSEDFESFSVSDGTLFDVEVVREEKRLYFRLVIPRSWAAAGLPLARVWHDVESLVLLS